MEGLKVSGQTDRQFPVSVVSLRLFFKLPDYHITVMERQNAALQRQVLSFFIKHDSISVCV